MNARNDWRANIKDIDNLYDVDPVCILIFLRYQYLLAAKDLMRRANENDVDFGLKCCMAAEGIEAALEAQYTDLEPFRN